MDPDGLQHRKEPHEIEIEGHDLKNNVGIPYCELHGRMFQGLRDLFLLFPWEV